jgi:hypothetical protein
MVPSQLMSLFHQAIYPKHIAAAIQNNEDLENLYHQGRASTVESTYRNKQHKKDESLSVEDDLIIHIAFVRLSIQLIAVILPFVGFVSIWCV